MNSQTNFHVLSAQKVLVIVDEMQNGSPNPSVEFVNLHQGYNALLFFFKYCSEWAIERNQGRYGFYLMDLDNDSYTSISLEKALELVCEDPFDIGSVNDPMMLEEMLYRSAFMSPCAHKYGDEMNQSDSLEAWEKFFSRCENLLMAGFLYKGIDRLNQLRA